MPCAPCGPGCTGCASRALCALRTLCASRSLRSLRTGRSLNALGTHRTDRPLCSGRANRRERMAVSAISAADPRTISAAAEVRIRVHTSGVVTASLIGNIIRQEKSPAFKEMGELVFSPHAYTMLNGGTACGTPMRRKGAAMAELSLCMIVKNEEARLGAVLEKRMRRGR